ncbi:Biopolymer transport protein ExbD [Posidoniimonas polymericola]|uniref:Biopolymer transport protein ExbD n=1 Tax=Posidoniimonas polymericola TaxID=2528002 RepID=A0A5C5XXT6_9BACT|nr:biopolymer transporter ExbD [Posidoniimonas polymericola]TWT67750.1 Biopolymer transport protein ExbD [Posidoniimonas polymericola]
MPLKVTQDENLNLNLTPMIDVVFLLVIFFMVATKFSESERNIELELPQVAAAGDAAAPAKPRNITVTADGATLLDGVEVTLGKLTSTLAEAVRTTSDVQVVINGDARTPFQAVAAALAACREARVEDLGITVELAAKAGGRLR